MVISLGRNWAQTVAYNKNKVVHSQSQKLKRGGGDCK